MSEQPHQEHAEALEQEAEDLERQSEQLKSDIKDARDDWEAKKRDDSVPGAQPVPDEPDEGEDSTDERQGPESASAKA
jgi:hypothetical protein